MHLAAVTLAIVFFALAGAAEAQRVDAGVRIGLLTPGVVPTQAEWSQSQLVQGLRDLGYVEGRNLVVERRYAEGKLNRLPDQAADLVRLTGCR